GEVDLARLLQCPERLDRRGHLHAVVGGRRVTAADLAPVRPGDQDRSPAAGAGVSGAGAVGEDGDSLHRGTCLYMIDDGRAASAPAIPSAATPRARTSERSMRWRFST